MKKIIFLIFSFLLIEFVGNAQCTNTSQFPGSTIAINPIGTLTTISTCSFGGEFSVLSGAVAGQTLQFTSSIGTDYITIHSGTSNGPVLAFGPTPLTFANTFTGTLYAHWSANSTCGTSSSCRTTTVQCLSCSTASGPCTNTSSFGSATINTFGGATTISTCSFAGEYSTITGAVAGQSLKFTSSVDTDFITIHSGTPNGAVLAFGQTPLTLANTFTGTLYAHWSTNSSCGTNSSCRNTTVECLSCTPAPAPINDNCSGALVLNCGGTITGNNSTATDEIGLPFCGNSSALKGVWFKITPTDNANITLATCGTTFDTLLRVYSGSCGSLSCVASNDDGCGLQSQLTFLGTAGNTYYILLLGFNSNSFGAYTLSATCETICTPTITCPGNITTNLLIPGQCGANVTFAATGTNSSVITYSQDSGTLFPIGTTTVTATATNTCGSASCSFTVTVNEPAIPTLNCGSSVSGNTTTSTFPVGMTGCFRDSNTDWYKITPTENTNITLSTCGGATWDTFLYVNTVSSCAVNCVASSDDFCGPQSQLTFSATAGTTYYIQVTGFSSTSFGPYTLTATCADPCIPPVITCPANIVVSNTPGQCGAIVSYPAATATGTPTPTITRTTGPASGSFFPVGTTTVTLTATNSCGAPTCSFTVTVNDTQAPSISCPANITGVVATSASGAVVNYTAPIGTDNCPGATTVRTAGLASGSTFPIGTTTVTHQVTDAEGLTAQCSFTVTVVGVAPQIVCPANIVVSNTPGQCGANVSFAATETVGIPASTISYSPASGSTFPVGTTTVTATATNAVGSSSCTFTVTVNDTQAPSITCAPAVVINNTPGLCTGTTLLPNPVVTDNCNLLTNEVIDNSQTTINNTWYTNGYYVAQSFTAGSSGNLSKVRLNVNQSGTGTIEIRSGADVCGTILFSGPITLNSGWNDYAISGVNVTSGSLYTINILSNNGTVLNLYYQDPGAHPGGRLYWAFCGNSVDWLALAFQTFITPNSISNNAPAVFPLGNTTVTWTATDSSGNTATCNQLVTVNDTEVPVITCPANIVVSNDANQCGANVSFAASATDNCGTANITYSPASGSFFAIGTTTVTATANDGHGNTASCTFTVTVNDTQAPSITCPANIVVSNDTNQCGANVSFAASATDNCGTANITYNLVSGSFFTTGTTTVTATADDGHGNTASCTFTVTVNDTQGPTMTCAAPISVQCPGDVVLTPPTVSDNCSLGVIYGPDLTVNGDFTSGGTNWDQCGNNVEAYGAETSYGGSNPFNMVAEVDHEPVTLCQSINGFVVGQTYQLTFKASRRDYAPSTVGADITIDGGALNTTVTRSNTSFSLTLETFTFVATQTTHQLTFLPSSGWYGTVGFIVDDITIKKASTIDNDAPANFPYGNTTVTWTAIDVSGNTSTCYQAVSVIDTFTPVISCPNNIVVYNTPGQCNTSVSWVAPIATDNCSVQSLVSNHAPGDDFPIGTTPVTYTATDAYGNSTSCSFNVTVNIGDIYYADNDGDGYGNPNVSQVTCSQPAGYVTDNTDCNDAVAAIHPGAVDIPYDSIDNNCDGSLYDGHAPVVVYVLSPSCGGINHGINNTINCTEIYLGPGYVIGYRFKVTNLITGQVAYVDTIQHHFKLSDTDIYAYGTPYSIQVAAIVNGEVQPFNGPTCTFTTTSVATTKVIASQCGSTLLFMNSTINASAVNQAITYRFRVARADAPGVYYLSPERTAPNFNLTMLTVPDGFLTYATEYKVDVQIKIKLANFIAWSQFGQVCSIVTPAMPEISIIASQCEMTATSNTQVINTTPFAGATLYRFRLTLFNLLGNLVFSQSVDTPNPYFTLSMFTGLLPSTTYTVSVSMKLYGSYVDYGKDCSVTSPGVLKTMLPTAFKAVAHPNPFANNFMIDVKSSSESTVNLKVYDMIGRLIEQREARVSDLETTTIGDRYPNGVYNVVVSQDENVQTVRVVKR